MTSALDDLVVATDAALATYGNDEISVCRAIRPAMAALLAHPQPVPQWAEEPYEGQAVGNLLHADPAGRFHVLAVVFPEGTSSGVHFHGCWGLIGYLRGGDEETRYRPSGPTTDRVELDEASRHVWRQGDITELLPPDDGWHRVRNPGPGDGVSIHVLCRLPAEHPHQFWDRSTGAVLPFPFVEVEPGRWRATINPTGD